MKLFLFLILLFSSSIYGQYRELGQRLAFADYLFCTKDYLRAAEEYEYIMQETYIDSLIIRTALSYYNIKDYDKSLNYLYNIDNVSKFNSYAIEKRTAGYFLKGIYDSLSNYNKSNTTAFKLYFYSQLLTNELNINVDDFEYYFEGEERNDALEFYDQRNNPSSKNGTLAAIFSTIIPGLGKFYTNRTSDGITSLIVTSLLGYLTYTNFKADHKVRGYIFAGLTGFFYAGNIYGSYLSANVYNKKISDDFILNLNVYLENKNHFVNDPQFCK